MFLQTAIGEGTSTGLDYLIGAMSFEEGSSSGVLSSIAIHEVNPQYEMWITMD